MKAAPLTLSEARQRRVEGLSDLRQPFDSLRSLRVKRTLLTLVAAAVAFAACKGGEPAAPTREDWTKRVQDAARDYAVAEPVTTPLAAGSEARAYAVCFDLVQKKEHPKDCVTASVFAIATPECPIAYRGLEGPFHEACALHCDDGCTVLDGLFARPVPCAEWGGVLFGGKAGCNYEMRPGIRLGPDDADGTPTQAERDAAHAVIEARKAL